MIETIRGLVEWAREAGISPWVAVWIVVGWLALRALIAAGGLLSSTARGFFAHYNNVIGSLEKRNEALQAELAAIKAVSADKSRDLAQSQALVTLLRERIDLLNTERQARLNPPNDRTGD